MARPRKNQGVNTPKQPESKQAEENKQPQAGQQALETEEYKQPTPVEENKQQESQVDNEPKVEESKPVEDKPAAAPKANKEPLTLDGYIESMLDDKFVGSLATVFKTYKETVLGPKAHNAKVVVGANYNLYKVIRSVLQEENYGIFKAKFDFINKVFSLGKNDAFDPSGILIRYDYQWSYGVKARDTYIKLVEFISALSNPKTRAKVKQVISINTISSVIETTEVSNLIRYYVY